MNFNFMAKKGTNIDFFLSALAPPAGQLAQVLSV